MLEDMIGNSGHILWLEVEKKTMEEANADRIASIDRNGITYWIGFG